MKWSVPNIWEGGDVWIIGGGPSIIKQFKIPEKVVKQVRDNKKPPSVYSPFMKDIHNKHVIAVNASFLFGSWIDMVFFGDNNFYLKFQNRLHAFKGIRVSSNPISVRTPWLKHIVKDPTKPFGLTSTPSNLCWNNCSGAAAINIAANTGAKRIFLLGFDMNMDLSIPRHWHNLYRPAAEEQVIYVNAAKKRDLPYPLHQKGFPMIAEDAKLRGIEIINVNPESEIIEFPKMSLEEALML